MKYFTFKCSKKEIDIILKDKVIKKNIELKIRYDNWLLLGTNTEEQLESYIMLKYGDFITNENVPSRKPKMFHDYVPKSAPKFVVDKNK